MAIARIMPRAKSLEERILRVLYEAPASTDECITQVVADVGRERLEPAVRRTFAMLIARAYVTPHPKTGALRYTLSPRGSERLACLAEGSAHSEAGQS
jgi:hypothetical protein